MLMGGFESPDPETGSESGDLFPRAFVVITYTCAENIMECYWISSCHIVLIKYSIRYKSWEEGLTLAHTLMIVFHERESMVEGRAYDRGKRSRRLFITSGWN